MIKLIKINKIYDSESKALHILKNIDLNIEQGDFIAIMGESGSGKTTLLNIIGLLDYPTSGQYRKVPCITSQVYCHLKGPP